MTVKFRDRVLKTSLCSLCSREHSGLVNIQFSVAIPRPSSGTVLEWPEKLEQLLTRGTIPRSEDQPLSRV